MTAGEDMTTAMANALAEGLDVEGVEQAWSKLNSRNSEGRTDEKPVENKIFYVDPVTLANKRKPKSRRKKSGYNPDQLCLDGF